MGKTWTLGVRTLTAQNEQLNKLVSNMKNKVDWLIKETSVQKQVIGQLRQLYSSKPTVATYSCSNSLCRINHAKFNLVKVISPKVSAVIVDKRNFHEKEETWDRAET